MLNLTTFWNYTTWTNIPSIFIMRTNTNRFNNMHNVAKQNHNLQKFELSKFKTLIATVLGVHA